MTALCFAHHHLKSLLESGTPHPEFRDKFLNDARRGGLQKKDFRISRKCAGAYRAVPAMITQRFKLPLPPCMHSAARLVFISFLSDLTNASGPFSNNCGNVEAGGAQPVRA
jgi:hypothetical protein